MSALIINWAMISIIHLMFRRAKRAAGQTTAFRSLGYPLSNYLTLVFLAGILVVMFLTPGLRISVFLIPFWVLTLATGYLFARNRSRSFSLEGA